MHKATILFAVNMDFESMDQIMAFGAMKQDVLEVLEDHAAAVAVSDIQVVETHHVVIPMPPCEEDRCCRNCRYEKAEAWQMPCLYCENASEWEMPNEK